MKRRKLIIWIAWIAWIIFLPAVIYYGINVPVKYRDISWILRFFYAMAPVIISGVNRFIRGKRKGCKSEK